MTTDDSAPDANGPRLMDGRHEWCVECDSPDIERRDDDRLKCRNCGEVWEQYGYSAETPEDHIRGER